MGTPESASEDISRLMFQCLEVLHVNFGVRSIQRLIDALELLTIRS